VSTPAPTPLGAAPLDHTAHEHEGRIDSAELFGALRAAADWLELHRDSVNALNVFPVPDGDTGTNMSLTMRAALNEVGGRTFETTGELARVISQGALMGARGNSGVILSQILRGFARGIENRISLTANDLAHALQEGTTTAYKGVMRPVEGTMLTVIREAAAAAAQAAAQGGDVLQVLASTLEEARASLVRTPELLPVLKTAGVVDAGGQGLVHLLEGALKFGRGEQIQLERATAMTEHVHAEMVEGDYNYDTQFILQGDGLDVDAIRDRIASMGDSVLVVGDAQTIKVHVHCDHPGEVLEYGITQGHVTAIIIENMQLQYEEFMKSQQPPTGLALAAASTLAEETGDISIVAVSAGAGLKRVFEGLGASYVVPGGQTMNPSTQDLLQAIDRVSKDQVILLPNNKNIILAAQQAKALSSKNVEVIATRSIPQGIAALLAYNFQAGLAENALMMAEMCTSVRTIEITRAVRTVQVNGLSVEQGQFIGLWDGDLITAGDSPLTVAINLLQRIGADEVEIVTLYYGQGVTKAEADAMANSIAQTLSHLEVEVVEGGQPHYHYIISAE
jgi:hypothetical protein